MTARVIVVECCKECPHVELSKGIAIWCHIPVMVSKRISDPSAIPAWCPLPVKERE